MKYFVAEGGSYVGPFEIVELQARGINADTYVCAVGAQEWRRAGDVPELQSILYAAPVQPAYPQQPTYPQQPQQPAYPQQPQQAYQSQQNYQQSSYPQQPQYAQGYQPQYAGKPLQLGSGLLVFAILETLFCCLITGIVGIVYWSNANTAAKMGDSEGMERAVKTAKTWLWVGFGVSLLIYLIYFIIVGGTIAGLASSY